MRWTITREQYEAELRREWLESAKIAGGWTEEQAQEQIDSQYPLPTKKAIEELEARGLDASPRRIQRLFRFP